MGDRGYSSREVAALTGLPRRRIWALARAGVVGGDSQAPRRARSAWFFSFADVRLLRTAQGLLQSGLAPKQVWRTMLDLRQQVRRSLQPLSSTTLVTQGDRVLACDGKTTWDTTDGQILLWYGKDAETNEVAPSAPAPMVAPKLPHQGGTEAADTWFERGLKAQEHDAAQAYDAYLKALAHDPVHVEAAINIGRLCSLDGDLQRAAGYFRLAVRVDPEHSVAQYNMAVTLHDLGQTQAALEAYRRALALDPDSEEARAHLGELLRTEFTP